MRYEIHEGELSVMPASDLGEVVPAPIAVVLTNTTIVEPDIICIANERMNLVSARGTVDGGPTLAVEILSPSTARNDRQTKKQLFERCGVPFYWIVDHDARAIEIYRAEAGVYGAADRRTTDLTDLPRFPGLRIDPAKLWR